MLRFSDLLLVLLSRMYVTVPANNETLLAIACARVAELYLASAELFFSPISRALLASERAARLHRLGQPHQHALRGAPVHYAWDEGRVRR